MDDIPEERKRRRRYRTMGPWWPPWVDSRFRPPPEVFYPGPYPWDPFMPARARRVDEITWLEDRLEELEDEKVEVERDIEDVRKEIERRKRDQGTEGKEK
jgi:hypothetical protein